MSISVTQRSLRRGARAAVQKPMPLGGRRTRAALLFLLPGLALFCLFVIYPIVSSIWLSFHHWDGMTEKTFAGLDNYRQIWSDRVRHRRQRTDLRRRGLLSTR